ncbi:hypothetical protein EV682_10266 [Iodobacter fluviatilis]|uniref:Uncharacterized protein n=1 Tax=Iodobacter fluviatilis TaxID=537 RepID=A0A377Q5K2_9NEIS|nr:hypothetical protein EV682_10266 [Iodobacter fluviatilis]STQ90524.1 Uncharacterised protein [Iodobacter fluviatilis]
MTYIAWCMAGRGSVTKGAYFTLKQGVPLPDQIKGWAGININQPRKSDLRGCAGDYIYLTQRTTVLAALPLPPPPGGEAVWSALKLSGKLVRIIFVLF